MRPLVSIIIPCLDAGKMLARCLDSCMNQTYPSLEVVFVDNGSTDGSPQLARDFAAYFNGRVVLAECSRRGACAARNAGFELARGDFIQWLDADDELTPYKIERQVAALEAAPASDVAYGDWMFALHGPAGVDVQPRPGAPVDDMLRELLLDRWRAPHAYLVRRSLADRLHAMQAFHPDTPVSQDREYFTLAAIHGARFVFVPGSLAIHNQWSRAQLSQSASRAARARVLARMFARFREHAAQQPPGRITPDHALLLEQPWDLFATPPVAFRATTGTFQAIDPATGVDHGLSPMEALLLIAITSAREPMDLEALAFVAATSPLVARTAAQSSGASDPGLAIHRALQDLANRGVLACVVPAEIRSEDG